MFLFKESFQQVSTTVFSCLFVAVGDISPVLLSAPERVIVQTCYATFETLFDAKVDTEVVRRIFCAARDGVLVEPIPKDISTAIAYLMWNYYEPLAVEAEGPNCTSLSYHNMSHSQIKSSISFDLENMKMKLQDAHLGMVFLNVTTCLTTGGLQDVGILLAKVYKQWLDEFANLYNNIKGVSVNVSSRPTVLTSEQRSLKICFMELESLLDSKFPTHIVNKLQCAARDGLHQKHLPLDRRPNADAWFLNNNSTQLMPDVQLNCSKFHFDSMTQVHTLENILSDLQEVKMRFEDDNLVNIYHMSSACSVLVNQQAGGALSDAYYQWYLRFMTFYSNTTGNNSNIKITIIIYILRKEKTVFSFIFKKNKK